MTIFFALWLAAVAAWGWRVTVEAAGAQRLRRECDPAPTEWLLADAAELGRRLRLRSPAQVRVGSVVSSPILTGIYAPAILLPRALLAGGSPDEVRGVLAHELAHQQRRDLWWNALATLAHGLFFFHPLAWLAGREARLAQEMACDELALRVSATPATEYGEALLKIASAGGAALGLIPWRVTTREDGLPFVLPAASAASRIVFASTRDGDMEIYTMLPDGSRLRRLTRDPRTDSRPEWSPDHRRIAWQRNEDGNTEIHVMNADGSNPRNLTRNPDNDEMPWASGMLGEAHFPRWRR